MGLRTILGLKPTEEVIRKHGLESFLRNRPNIKSQWDGTGHSNKTGFLKKWKKVAMDEKDETRMELGETHPDFETKNGRLNNIPGK